MSPDFLAPGDAWVRAQPAARRKRMGQWLTPWWVIEAALDQALDGLGPAPTVLDPSCGDGRWLLAVARRRPDARLIGWDLDPGALDAARRAAAMAGVAPTLRERDALQGDEAGIADLVVGNPPYVRPQHLPAEVRARVWARYRTATNKADLYAPFIERMLSLTRGRLAVAVADSWLSMASFAALRREVLAHPVDLIARLPSGAFGAAVGTVLLCVRPRDDAPRGRRRWGQLTPDGLVVDGPIRVSGDLILAADAPDLVGHGVLGDRWRLRMGVVCGDYKRWVRASREAPEDHPTCRGRDVGRFQLRDRGEFLRYRPREMLAARPYVAPKWAGLFDVPEKLVLAGTSGGELRAAVDTGRRFPLDSCYVSQGDGDVWALCGLLNAAPVNAWYRARFPAPRVKAVELRGLPWPAGGLGRVAEAARAADQDGVDREVAIAYGL